MTTYAIGDVQGCYDSFMALLQHINYREGIDTLWLAGDVINRGPKSLDVLRWLYAHRDTVCCVLGNHELYWLRTRLLEGKVKKDTLSELNQAHDGHMLFQWVRTWPLMHESETHIMVHAGFSPRWHMDDYRTLTAKMRMMMKGDASAQHVLSNLYARTPQQDIRGDVPMMHAMTHIRGCTRDGTLSGSKRGPEHLENGVYPWYDVFSDWGEKQVLFGHWAAHGAHCTARWVSLDSGCVWGNRLTAYALDSGHLFSVPAQESSRR